MTRARRQLIGLGAPTFGLALSATAAGTYLPLIAHQFGASSTTTGLLLATQGVALAVFATVVGSLSDRVGARRDYLLAGSTVGACALALAALAGAEWLMAVGALLFFASYVIAYEPYRALILDVVPVDRLSSAQGVQAAWRTSGTAVALMLGGVLAAVSLHAPLLGAAACLLVSGVAGRKLLPAVKPVAGTRGSSVLRTLSTSGGLRRSLIVTGLAELSQGVLRAFSLLYATQRLRFSAGSASFVFAAFVVVSVLAAVAGAAAANRIGARRTVLAGGALLAVGLAVVAAGGTDTILLAAAIIASAAGSGIVSALSYALGARDIPVNLRGALTGTTTSVRGVGMALGPVLGAVAVTAGGYAAAFWVACAATLLMLAVLLRD
jgi:MFS family permease